MTTTCQSDELKDKGNACVKDGKYGEAVLHYTQAIKINPKNAVLYSNRSLAYLRANQHYLALQDAKEAIQLNRTWAKGYFRQGEVERSACRFTDALLSYRRALALQPDDPTIIEAVARTAREHHREDRDNRQIPWLGAGLGIITGVAIVISDYAFTQKPTLSHPILMALLTVMVAIIGYGIAYAVRYYSRCQKEALLDPPFGMGEKEDGELEEEEDVTNAGNGNASQGPNGHRIYTKAQARFRYKKGRS